MRFILLKNTIIATFRLKHWRSNQFQLKYWTLFLNKRFTTTVDILIEIQTAEMCIVMFYFLCKSVGFFLFWLVKQNKLPGRNRALSNLCTLPIHSQQPSLLPWSPQQTWERERWESFHHQHVWQLLKAYMPVLQVYISTLLNTYSISAHLKTFQHFGTLLNLWTCL